MDVKLFELRDKMTFIPVAAVRLMARGQTEHYLLRRAGYADAQIRPCRNCDGKREVFDAPNRVLDGVPYWEPCTDCPEPYVIIFNLNGDSPANYDPHNWSNPRTWGAAHLYLIAHWDTLTSGDVIDVEFILGETTEPKKSEAVTHG